jgi:hypothetical protein
MTSDKQTTHLEALRNDLVERRRLAALDLKVGATTADRGATCHIRVDPEAPV